jgi:hypothetical protein
MDQASTGPWHLSLALFHRTEHTNFNYVSNSLSHGAREEKWKHSLFTENKKELLPTPFKPYL